MKRLEKISWDPSEKYFVNQHGRKVYPEPRGDTIIFEFNSPPQVVTDKLNKIDFEGFALGANAYNEGKIVYPRKGYVHIPIQFYKI